MEAREYNDAYSEALEAEFRDLEHALLSDTVKLLQPNEPLRVAGEATVHEAIGAMVENRRAAVVVVDEEGRLLGIFTERDVLTRVIGQGRDPALTAVREVMTLRPEALSVNDRICLAINRMNNAGYRTIPLVDDAGKPIGIVTVNDVVRWLAEIFPEAVLNAPPADWIRRPDQIDAG